MVKVPDRLALAILGLCAGGTFIGLALTSIAKKAGQTGPPPKPDFPWLQQQHQHAEGSLESRLKQFEQSSIGAVTAAAIKATKGGAAEKSGGGQQQPQQPQGK